MNVRLCYASQRNENNEDLLQDLRDILTEARDFNDLNEICGVLYYADNASVSYTHLTLPTKLL